MYVHHVAAEAWAEMRSNPSLARDGRVRELLEDVTARLGRPPESLEDLFPGESLRLSNAVTGAQTRAATAARLSRSGGHAGSTPRLNRARLDAAKVSGRRVSAVRIAPDGTQTISYRKPKAKRRPVSAEQLAEQRRHLEDARQTIDGLLRSGKVLSSANRAKLETALEHLNRARKHHDKVVQKAGVAADAINAVLAASSKRTAVADNVRRQRLAAEMARRP